MMAETATHAHIKQEIDTTCCSPSPSNGSFTSGAGFIFNNSTANTVCLFFFSRLRKQMFFFFAVANATLKMRNGKEEKYDKYKDLFVLVFFLFCIN